MFGGCSVVVAIFHFATGIHELNCGLVALGNGDVVLGANIPKRGNIKLGSCDPAKALAKGVVRVDDIPMAGRVWHIHGTFGPIVVPLGHLDERKCCEDKAKESAQHGFLSILHNCNTVGAFGLGSLVSSHGMDALNWLVLMVLGSSRCLWMWRKDQVSRYGWRCALPSLAGCDGVGSPGCFGDGRLDWAMDGPLGAVSENGGGPRGAWRSSALRGSKCCLCSFGPRPGFWLRQPFFLAPNPKQ